MMFMRTRAVVLLGLVFAASVSAWLFVARARPRQAAVDPVLGLPLETSIRSDLKKQMAVLSARRAAQGGPKLVLPEQDRAGWIAAWDKLRECALAHGFDGVSPVQRSYGDGNTPSPVIAGSGPIADAALTACPFDTGLFQADRVRAAVESQLELRRNRAPRP